MTSASDNRTLTHDKLRQLIEAAQQGVQATDEEQIEAVEVDWNRPHHFNFEQYAALDIFIRKTQENFTDTLDALCEGPFKIEARPPGEYFASVLAAGMTTANPSHYYLPLMTDDREHCGFVSFSIETASVMVALMLREQQVSTEERKLSGLEDSILMDITATLVETFASTVKKRNGPNISCGQNFVKGIWPVDFEGIEDLTTLTYDMESPTVKFEMAFTVLSTSLEPVAGAEHDSRADLTEEQRSGLLMKHVNRVPVTVTARLCTASIELDDIMNLKKGDLLLLKRKVAKPLEVLLNDRECFSAYPATYRGKYALVISPPYED